MAAAYAKFLRIFAVCGRFSTGWFENLTPRSIVDAFIRLPCSALSSGLGRWNISMQSCLSASQTRTAERNAPVRACWLNRRQLTRRIREPTTRFYTVTFARHGGFFRRVCSYSGNIRRARLILNSDHADVGNQLPHNLRGVLAVSSLPMQRHTERMRSKQRGPSKSSTRCQKNLAKREDHDPPKPWLSASCRARAPSHPGVGSGYV